MGTAHLQLPDVVGSRAQEAGLVLLFFSRKFSGNHSIFSCVILQPAVFILITALRVSSHGMVKSLCSMQDFASCIA